MSLASRLPTGDQAIDEARVFTLLWVAAASFCALIPALFLLDRLGMPIALILRVIDVSLVAGFIVLVWNGRTMTSRSFFFADRMGGVATSGLGGSTDWVSGAILIVFFSTDLMGRMVLAPCLMMGLFLQAVLFARTFHRSGASTVPGYFVWRASSSYAGIMPLIVVAVILGCLLLAEFQIALSMISALAQTDSATATLLLLALALFAVLCGGRLSLLIANAAIALWLIVSLLLPALITGVLPSILQNGLDKAPIAPLLKTLSSSPDALLYFSGSLSTVVMLACAAVFATGFSCLPHTLSRLSIASRSMAAVESLGWTAMIAFLILGALPLSIGLIGIRPSSTTLAGLLQANPVLHALPYYALFFAAFNALCSTLLALSASLVWVLKRQKSLDPGEQSVFSTRALAMLIAAGLYSFSTAQLPTIGALIATALALASAALFAPLVASMWIARIGWPWYSGAISIGAIIVGLPFAIGLVFPNADEVIRLLTAITGGPVIVMSGAAGLIISSLVLALGYGAGMFGKSRQEDEQLILVRSQEVSS